ncbi:MAG TPA: AAA family ATPase, partial [Solirubrobacteraceae bacterium]|nr:AAA family ATPase [Solirubrobacteraceae bacterium]
AGKSTLIEGLAWALGFDEQGGTTGSEMGKRVRGDNALGAAIDLELGPRKPREGFFLRAESFFNVARFVDGATEFAPDLSLYGDVPLHQQSHGQSFLALAANRFGGEGLYVLDEPEAALSVSGSLALLAIMVRAARAGAQFILATHSPILLACPDAHIYELDDRGLARCAYDDLDVVRFTRSFLDTPDRFIHAALADLDAE